MFERRIPPKSSSTLNHRWFNVDLENGVITDVLEKKTNIDMAATDALKRHPELLKTWLDGVNTVSGANGLQAVQTVLGVK